MWRGSNACRGTRCTRSAEGSRSQAKGSSTRRGTGPAEWAGDFPIGGQSEIRPGERRKGTHAHLPRSIQRQQGHERQWRPEVAQEGGRLLQRMQQAPQRAGLIVNRARAATAWAFSYSMRLPATGRLVGEGMRKSGKLALAA